MFTVQPRLKTGESECWERNIWTRTKKNIVSDLGKINNIKKIHENIKKGFLKTETLIGNVMGFLLIKTIW